MHYTRFRIKCGMTTAPHVIPASAHVIPVETGIHEGWEQAMDPCFRRDDIGKRCGPISFEVWILDQEDRLTKCSEYAYNTQ